MKPSTFALVLLALAPGMAHAQEKPAMMLNVSPSGYENEEAHTRGERLLKRMQQTDYLLRNICIHCGAGINRPGAYGPIDPLATLGRR